MIFDFPVTAFLHRGKSRGKSRSRRFSLRFAAFLPRGKSRGKNPVASRPRARPGDPKGNKIRGENVRCPRRGSRPRLHDRLVKRAREIPTPMETTCGWCGRELKDRRRKFCCDKCKAKKSQWPGGREQMMSQKREARQRRIESLERMQVP